MKKSRLLGSVCAVLLTAIPFSAANAITVQVEFSAAFNDIGAWAGNNVPETGDVVSGLFQYEAPAIDAAPSSTEVSLVDLTIVGYSYPTDNFILSYSGGLMTFCAGEPVAGACGIGPVGDRFAIRWDWDGGSERLLEMKYSIAAVNDYWIADLVNDPNSLTITAIPVTPAVWLFGSGLLGLAGIARRRQAA